MAKTKQEIVPVSQQIAKLSQEDMTKLFKSDSSGLDGVEDSRTMPFPLELGIVQKLTGDNLFEDPAVNDRSAQGKIFIRPRKVKNAEGKYVYDSKLTSSDLMDSVELTLLKVEFGVEIWRKENREGLDFPVTVTYCRSKKMIKANERDAWIEAHNPNQDEMGYRYTNQVRLILTPYSSKEVVDMVSKGENPFVTISLSGTDGWNTWGVINEEMTKVKKQAGVKGELKDVLSSVFKINLSTVKTKSGANEYYIFDAKVSLNDLQEALRFEELVNSLDKEFTFFFNTSTQDPSLREVEEINIEDVYDVKKEIELDDELEEITDEDLPF